MRKILIASHGELAKGAKQAIELLIGERSDIFEISAYVDDVSLEDQINNFFNLVEDEELLIFTDMFGGSVNNTFCKYLERKNTYLVAGFNLSLILDLLFKEDINEKIIKDSIDQAREAIVYVTLEEDEVEEDFY